jgi:hypothetical protein
VKIIGGPIVMIVQNYEGQKEKDASSLWQKVKNEVFLDFFKNWCRGFHEQNSTCLALPRIGKRMQRGGVQLSVLQNNVRMLRGQRSR